MAIKLPLKSKSPTKRGAVVNKTTAVKQALKPSQKDNELFAKKSNEVNSKPVKKESKTSDKIIELEVKNGVATKRLPEKVELKTSQPRSTHNDSMQPTKHVRSYAQLTPAFSARRAPAKIPWFLTLLLGLSMILFSAGLYVFYIKEVVKPQQSVASTMSVIPSENFENTAPEQIINQFIERFGVVEGANLGTVFCSAKQRGYANYFRLTYGYYAYKCKVAVVTDNSISEKLTQEGLIQIVLKNKIPYTFNLPLGGTGSNNAELFPAQITFENGAKPDDNLINLAIQKKIVN
jgi:hypothetical protein